MSARQFLLLITVVNSILILIDANDGGRSCTDPSREVYLNPGPSCERTCAALDQPCGKVYVLPPTGCYCADGLARDAYGKCIPIRFCKR